jgi:hypothetical protein
MREVLRATRERDSQAAEWLEIIDRFDAVVAADADTAELARVAQEITGLTVVVRDDWNAIDLELNAGGASPGTTTSADAAAAIYRANVRGRNSVVLQLDGCSAIVCSVEGSSGRFGFVGLFGKRTRKWGPIDHLVVERLAVAVASRARRDRDVRMRSDFDSPAIERLLEGGLSELEVGAVARQMKIPVSGEYLVAALEQEPPNAIAPEALGAIVERLLRTGSPVVRGTVIGRTVVIVASVGERLSDLFDELASDDSHPGYELHIGLGEPTSLSDLDRSWEEARESLAFRSLIPGDAKVKRFSEIGVLHLLAQIPEAEIMRVDLFRRLISSAMQKGDPPDIDVLRAYLEEGTLRGAAARIFLHHTTVENRVRRIEKHLGLDLADPAHRFQAQLLLDLYRISEARSATRDAQI